MKVDKTFSVCRLRKASAERIFCLLFVTYFIQSSAYKGHTEKNIDRFDLLGLQFPAFILMTLQNTLRSLIQICMEIPTLWFNIIAFGICSVVKLHVETTKSSSDFTFQSVHGKSGSFILVSSYLPLKKTKKTEKALCIKHIIIDTRLLVTKHHTDVYFSPCELCLANSPEDLLFLAECSVEAKESNSF